MDIKDIFYIAGILTSIIIGSVSLWLNLKNRSNALREALFKEQLRVVQGIREKAWDLEDNMDQWFDDISNEALLDAADDSLEAFDKYLNANDIVLTDEVIVALNRFLSIIHTLFGRIYKTKNAPSESEMERIRDEFFELEDKLRDLIGVDPLSEENKRLIGSNRNIAKRK